jgi:hypothetical protein
MIARHSRGLFAALVAVSAMLPLDVVDARPQYANETGTQCNFCHIGQMNSKQFTSDGVQYCQYLKSQGTLPPPQCAIQTIDLYDNVGNFLQTYSHCVPVSPPLC